MNKEDFVRSMAGAEGIKINEAREQVNRFLDHVLAVVPTLEDGESLDFTGIVSFKVKGVEARSVRNPKSGEIVDKEATRKVSASAKAKLKKAVKGQ
jgi:DNA-binding protein HU-beta